MTSKKERIISVLFSGASDSADFSIDVVSPASRSVKTLGCLKKPEKCSDFLKQITSCVQPSSIKAMVFLLFTKGEQDCVRQQQIVKQKFQEFCKKHDIFCHFPSIELVTWNGLLESAKPKINDEEFIAIVILHGIITFQILQYSDDGKNYEFIKVVKSPFSNIQATKKMLMEKYNLKHLIFFGHICEHGTLHMCENENQLDKITNLFSSDGVKISVFNESYERMFFDTSIKMIRNLMDGNGMENMIKHFCPTELLIGSIIKCENGQPLPFEKTAIYNISKGNCIPFRETGKGKIETINLSQFNSEKVEITFKLDIDMIYDIQIKAIGPPLKSASKKSSKVIPEKSAQKNVEKVKIIFTQTHFSIFIVKDGKKKVIKDSNGSTNIPHCISFVEDIPIVGKKAEESLLTQPTFVVYDLMKLCSKDVLQNKDPKWPFKLRKNSKTIFLVEFDTVSGRRKKAADVFIKVILIFCLELIEKESGKNFKEIGIEFEGFGNQEDLCECFLKAADRINMKLVFL